MNKNNIKILAIESSCDETAAAVIGIAQNPKHEIRNSKQIQNSNDLISKRLESLGFDDSKIVSDFCPFILSNIVFSQVDLHAETGGVVPEVASRAHMEAIIPVVTAALSQGENSNIEIRNLNLTNSYDEAVDYLKNEITHIAVTAGPGLIGSLLVGFNAAKALAYALDKPIIPINHIEGHIYSAQAEKIRNPTLSSAESARRMTGSKSEILNKSQNQNIPNMKYSENLRFKDLDIVSNFDIRGFEFPLLALVVSGGHTSLILMKGHGQYEIIGQTLDDAAGEAFDKVAHLLGLGYPGGPAISKIASKFRENPKSDPVIRRIGTSDNSAEIRNPKQKLENLENSKIKKFGIVSNFDIRVSNLKFPRPILNDGTFNFSFSGLKTAVLVEVKRRHAAKSLRLPEEGSGTEEGLSSLEKAEIATAFEDAAIDVLVTKTMRAIEQYKPKTVVLAGGVAANEFLRRSLKSQISDLKFKVNLLCPPIELCGDNAAMIGLAAYYHILGNDIKSWAEIHVDSNWELG